MPRQIKYEDAPFEKAEYCNKIFMYNEPTWNVLFPIVDIIRALEKHTIISFKYGKGTQFIKMYGIHHNHLVTGYDLKNKNDYTILSKANIKFIFIFTDTPDIIATNLIKIGQTFNIPTICYSNVDHVYHCYENDKNNTVTIIPKSIDVIEYINNIKAKKSVEKLAELFPEFEIVDLPEENSYPVLEECLKKLRIVTETEKNKKETNKTLRYCEPSLKKFYDPNLNKLKKLEYDRSQHNKVYEDDLETINKNIKHAQLAEQPHKKNVLSKFFTKKINTVNKIDKVS